MGLVVFGIFALIAEDDSFGVAADRIGGDSVSQGIAGNESNADHRPIEEQISGIGGVKKVQNARSTATA
jgi:hypothetical protein